MSGGRVGNEWTNELFIQAFYGRGSYRGVNGLEVAGVHGRGAAEVKKRILNRMLQKLNAL